MSENDDDVDKAPSASERSPLQLPGNDGDPPGDRNAPKPPADGQAKPFGVPWTVEAIDGGPMALEQRLNQLGKAGYAIMAGCGIQQVPLADNTIGIMVIAIKMPQMPKIARPGDGPLVMN